MRCHRSVERTVANLWRLIGADDLEVVVDEDVVRPADANVVDLVFAVTQLHNTVDDAPRRPMPNSSITRRLTPPDRFESEDDR